MKLRREPLRPADCCKGVQKTRPGYTRRRPCRAGRGGYGGGGGDELADESADDAFADGYADDEMLAQEEWENQEGEAWRDFSAGYVDGWEAGCETAFEGSPDGSLYNGGDEFTVDDCLRETPYDASYADVPLEVPYDPYNEKMLLGESDGCLYVYEELSPAGLCITATSRLTRRSAHRRCEHRGALRRGTWLSSTDDAPSSRRTNAARNARTVRAGQAVRAHRGGHGRPSATPFARKPLNP